MVEGILRVVMRLCLGRHVGAGAVLRGHVVMGAVLRGLWQWRLFMGGHVAAGAVHRGFVVGGLYCGACGMETHTHPQTPHTSP